MICIRWTRSFPISFSFHLSLARFMSFFPNVVRWFRGIVSSCERLPVDNKSRWLLTSCSFICPLSFVPRQAVFPAYHLGWEIQFFVEQHFGRRHALRIDTDFQIWLISELPRSLQPFRFYYSGMFHRVFLEPAIWVWILAHYLLQLKVWSKYQII